ncbi:MAG TPA: hypothetical protein PK185_16220 [Cyclobacteriaceae bacterium]|nr:hypothetical protein [Cyclobacteriaceae bacterium]
MEKETEVPEPKKKLSFKEFFNLGEVGGYFFRGKDDSRPTNINLKMMHGVNKISIVMFLLGLLYIILKRVL